MLEWKFRLVFLLALAAALAVALGDIWPHNYGW
jgi:hypothetical protein